MNVACYVFLTLPIASAFLIASAPPRQTSISAPAYRQLEDQGFDHFYSLEYDQAIATFQKLRDRDPDNPNFHNHLASAFIYKQLHIAGVLEGDMFTASNKFFRTKKIQVDPTLDKNFWDENGAAIRICEQRLRRDKKDQDALYACGVAYATLATHQGLIDRAKVETLATGRKASLYHSELMHLDSQQYDAYLVPGIYDYVLGSLPTSLRVLLLFGGFSGARERGLRSVEIAAEQGDRAKQDARILLAVMYRREKQYPDARRVLGLLAQAFPRNYIFPLEIAAVYRSAGQDGDAIRAYERVLEDFRSRKTGYAETPVARIHHELGGLYWKAGNLELAKAHFEQVAGSFGSTPELEAESAQMRAQIEEALRQRRLSEQKPPSGPGGSLKSSVAE